MELIKDYDCVIDYHSGKANVVADALSRKSIQTLRALNAHLSLPDDGTVVEELIVRPSLLEAQKKDEKIAVVINQIGNGKETEFTVNKNGVLYYKDWVCVPDCNDLRKSKCCGKTTRPKKPLGKVKKRSGSSIRICLTKVISRTKFY